MPPVRLQKLLSSAGVAARRKAEELITAGRVTVNGEIVRVLGTKVDPERDSVTVDGEAIAAHDTFYVLLNKPKACITAVSDDRGRPTVMDFLPNVPIPVRPVGRLDFYTEGVLLLTNDGELAARLLAPSSHVPKTYHVKVHGQVSADDVKALRKGVRLDDGTVTMPAEVNLLPGESKHTWLGITIHEGKQRQIHRMLEALGYYVDKLQRVAFANLTFHGLRVGDARELTQTELNALREFAGLPPGPVARGRWQARREATDIPRRARAKAREEHELASAEPGAAPASPTNDARGPRSDSYDSYDARGPRNDSRGPRTDSRDSRGARTDSRGPRTDSRGPRTDSRGPRADSRDSRGARSDSRDARGSRNDSRGSRGPRTDPRGPRTDSRDARGPRTDSRDGRGPRTDSRGPRTDSRGPRTDSRDARGPRADSRGPRGPRNDSRGPRSEARGERPREAGGRRSFGKR